MVEPEHEGIVLLIDINLGFRRGGFLTQGDVPNFLPVHVPAWHDDQVDLGGKITIMEVWGCLRAVVEHYQ